MSAHEFNSHKPNSLFNTKGCNNPLHWNTRAATASQPQSRVQWHCWTVSLVCFNVIYTGLCAGPSSGLVPPTVPQHSTCSPRKQASPEPPLLSCQALSCKRTLEQEEAAVALVARVIRFHVKTKNYTQINNLRAAQLAAPLSNLLPTFSQKQIKKTLHIT